MLSIQKPTRQAPDFELIALGDRFDAALARANKLIDALPGKMRVADEFAAIETATAPVMAVVEKILAAWAYSPAGYATQSRVSTWASGH